MMRLSRFLGFFPNLEDYREGDFFFDLRNAFSSQFRPLHPDYLRPDEAAKICLLMRMNFETMHLFAMSRQGAQPLCGAHHHFLSSPHSQLPRPQITRRAQGTVCIIA